MATNLEFAQLSDAAYQNDPASMQLPQGWSVVASSKPDDIFGYKGYAYKNNTTGEIVIANRGTEPLGTPGVTLDYSNDLQLITNKLPDQYPLAQQFYNDVSSANSGAQITLTGHSLGGSLSQLLAAESTKSGNITVSAVTFNPYGTKDIAATCGVDPNGTYNNITNHQTMLDGVSRADSQSPIGSDQLGQMQTHAAPTEYVAAAMIAGSALLGPDSAVAFPATFLAVKFGWSHSIDRFTQEIFAPPTLTSSAAKGFVDFAHNLGNQINGLESSITSAADPIVTALQNDFQQLSGAIGQGYQGAVNSVSAAMAQIASAMTAAEKSAVQTFLDFAFGFGNTINGMEQSIANFFNAARAWAAPRFDPLILDLNGSGIETIAPNAATPILFDLNGDGIKTGTGWVAATDGFLVLDRNGNGTIDNGTELFGDSTQLAAGGTAADGFAALAGQDSNLDGVVNALDANFANLQVWQDLNQDGISQAGELKTLTELGIASLNIAKTANSQTLAGGNQIADLGSFVRADGTTAVMADVNLASDAFHRSFTDVIPAYALSAALPDVQHDQFVVLRDEAANPIYGAANDAGFEMRSEG